MGTSTEYPPTPRNESSTMRERMQITTTEMVQGPLRAMEHSNQEMDYSNNSKQQFTTQYI